MEYYTHLLTPIQRFGTYEVNIYTAYTIDTVPSSIPVAVEIPFISSWNGWGNLETIASCYMKKETNMSKYWT